MNVPGSEKEITNDSSIIQNSSTFNSNLYFLPTNITGYNSHKPNAFTQFRRARYSTHYRYTPSVTSYPMRPNRPRMNSITGVTASPELILSSHPYLSPIKFIVPPYVASRSQTYPEWYRTMESISSSQSVSSGCTICKQYPLTTTGVSSIHTHSHHSLTSSSNIPPICTPGISNSLMSHLYEPGNTLRNQSPEIINSSTLPNHYRPVINSTKLPSTLSICSHYKRNETGSILTRVQSLELPDIMTGSNHAQIIIELNNFSPDGRITGTNHPNWSVSMNHIGIRTTPPNQPISSSQNNFTESLKIIVRSMNNTDHNAIITNPATIRMHKNLQRRLFVSSNLGTSANNSNLFHQVNNYIQVLKSTIMTEYNNFNVISLMNSSIPWSLAIDRSSYSLIRNFRTMPSVKAITRIQNGMFYY